MSILTVKQIAARYEAFSESTIRNWINDADKNGMHVCIIRPPNVRRVFIDVMKFEQWLRGFLKDKIEAIAT